MLVQLCQVNPTIGDLKSNFKMMIAEIDYAAQQNMDVVVFPELVTTGYPPRDFLYRTSFWESHERVVQKIATHVKSIRRRMTVIFGGLHQVQLTNGRFARYNAAFIVDQDGVRVIHKRLLPCYDVFDETRYFRPAESDDPILPVQITLEDGHVVRSDVLICEDIWNYKFSCDSPWLPGTYDLDPVSHLVGDGPIFVINGSPFWKGKVKTTITLVEDICRDLGRPVLYVNQIGAHDDIITHGGSIVSIPPEHSNRKVYSRIGKLFATERMVVRIANADSKHHMMYPHEPVGEQGPLGLHMPKWFTDASARHDKIIDPKDFDAWCNFHALKLHIQDYCRRTGFKEVVLGLSGGIDSALVATIAVEALGSQNVHGVTMPSKFSSKGSWMDARELANNLHLGSFQNIAIEGIHTAARESLLSGGKQEFDHGVTDENLQPRARGIILMGLSNDNGWLLLTTGNKSELAVGYCTLYGDMCGGLAVISDIPKLDVYAMCEAINKYSPTTLIPEDTITKPPSAELRADQVDSATLPDYKDLDPLLEMIYADRSIEYMLKHSTIPDRVHEVVGMVVRNEYKRKQIPDGPKVSEKAFGSGRRMPVAAKYNLV